MGLPTPAGSQPAAAAPGSVSVIQNNINALKEFKITITTDAQGGGSNIALFPGPVPTFTGTRLSITYPDQNHTKVKTSVTGDDATGYSELKDFLSAVGMHIVYMRFQTNVIGLYDGSLFVGEMPINGLAAPEEIPLASYATVLGGGGGYDKTLLIADHPIVNTKNFFMYLSAVPASAVITIACGVDVIGNTITGTPA